MKGRTVRGIMAVYILLILTLTVPVISAEYGITSSTIIDNNSINVVIHSNVPVTIDPATPNYEATSETVTYNNVTYDAVSITNDNNTSGGVSNGNGRVNVTFDLNDSRPFCMEIHHATIDISRLTINVTIDGTTKQYTDSKPLGELLTDSRHYIGYDTWYTSAQALNNANDWIQSDSVINIQIQDSYGFVPDNVTLKIVFKP